MGYRPMLSLALACSITLLIFSFISVILTAHYWFLGDWFFPRTLESIDTTLTTLNGLAVHIEIILYKDEPTTTLVVSACLGIFAAVVGILSWAKLKHREMDDEVQLPRRRFYVGFVCLSMCGAFVSCLVAFTFHFTNTASTPEGCTSTTNQKGDLVWSCSREMGACRLVKDWMKEAVEVGNNDHPWVRGLACNEAQAVKWFQLLIALICLVSSGLFITQAMSRRKSRYHMVGKTGA